jgi:hypothetical protein
MHRSYWDIEAYARDFHERHAQEAARRRLADEAASRGVAHPANPNPFNLAVARFLGTLRARLSSGRYADAGRADAESQAAARIESVSQPERALPIRLTQPYADMVVIARGTKAGVVEQPSVVSDC